MQFYRISAKKRYINYNLYFLKEIFCHLLNNLLKMFISILFYICLVFYFFQKLMNKSIPIIFSNINKSENNQ